MVDTPPIERVAVGEMPEHVCPECTSLRFGREPSCVDCGTTRPEDGWVELTEVGDQLLGRTVDRRFLLTRRLYRSGGEALYRATSLSDGSHFGLWIHQIDAFDCSRIDIAERMESEVPKVRQIGSKHLVPAHEMLEFADDRVAIVMDHPAGVVLHDVVSRNGPLDVDRACRLGAQLARGLQQAHGAQLVHCQLDPLTVVISKAADGDECAQMINFGLAALKRRSEQGRNLRAFASPEQRRGRNLDHASNVFSFGALLYFMLTAKAPEPQFAANESWGVRVETEMSRVSEVREADDVPAVLDTLVAAMMARSPSGRPENWDEVIDLLERHSREAPAETGFSSSSQPDSHPGALSQAGNTEASHSPGQTLTNGSYFQFSEKTSVGRIEPPKTPAPTSKASTQKAPLSPPPPKERLPKESLPNDLGATSSVPFWNEAVGRTDTFGWINRPQTGPHKGTTTNESPEDESEPAEAAKAPEASATDVSQDTGAPEDNTASLGRIICATTDRQHRVLVAVEDHELWLVDGPACDEPSSLGTLQTPPRSVALWGEKLLVGLADGTIEQRDIDGTHAEVLLETIDRASITGLAVDPGSDMVVAAAASGRVYTATLGAKMSDSSWERVRSKEEAVDVAIGGSSGFFAVLRLDSTVEVRSAEPPHRVQCSFRCSGGCQALALSSDGQLVAVVSDDTVRLHHAGSGQQVAAFENLTHRPTAIYFTASNDLVGLCQGESGLVLWDLSTDSALSPKRRKQKR